MLSEQESQAIWPRNTTHSTIDPLYQLNVSRHRTQKQPYSEYLLTPHWRQMRRRILARDKYRCVMCNTGKLIEVHHRTYERLGYEDDSDCYTVCRGCHAKHHGKEPLICDAMALPPAGLCPAYEIRCTLPDGHLGMHEGRNVNHVGIAWDGTVDYHGGHKVLVEVVK